MIKGHREVPLFLFIYLLRYTILVMNKQTIKCDYCDSMILNTPRSIGSHIGYWHKNISREIYHKDYKFKILCLECNNAVANSNNVLARHLRKEHSMSWQEYEIKHKFGGIWPLCKCGCLNRLKWFKGGFREYINGHNSSGESNGMYGRKGEESPTYGMKRSLSHRKILSDSAVKKLKEGKIGPSSTHRCEWKWNPYTERHEYMHSSWESLFLEVCISKNFPITKNHDIKIEYKGNDGFIHAYIPDFISLDSLKIYEIKGHKTEIDKIKWRAARKWCKKRDAEFIVLTSKDSISNLIF